MSELLLDLYQFAPKLRDPAANFERIAARATASADILLTPELSVTGYDLRDDAIEQAVPLVRGAPVSSLHPVAAGLGGTGTAVVLGLVERGRDGIPYNSAVVVRDEAIRFRHRKLCLPTYGMFDEGRFFGRGTRVRVWRRDDWRFGILICEDVWHPALAWLLAGAGIDALFVMAAAPGRDVRVEADGSTFASSDSWERIARVTAHLYGIYVALANRTGVEGGVTFAGGSLVVDPSGDVLARAGLDEEVLRVELRAGEVARARRTYAHIRDDDAGIVRHALERRP
jgi:predicted amidohydrolase